MRGYRLLLSVVLLAVLHVQGATAQRGRDDRDDEPEGPRGRDSTCTAGLDDERVEGTLNVVGRCQLAGTEVRGDVILFAGGSLTARGARIRGTVEGDRADFVVLNDTRVDGNVTLQDLVGDSSSIESSDIRGNVVLTGNRSRFTIIDNEIRRDLTALGNTGGLQISGNSIDGDLNCSGNAPAPTLLGNRIEGDAEGQCATVRPQPAAPATPPTSPPAAPRPAATPAPAPAATTPPAAAPAAEVPPAVPPAVTPPAAAPDPALLDDGGAGALGWPTLALLLPLLAWRRVRRI